VPSGGTAGQLLSRTGAGTGTSWINPPSALPSGAVRTRLRLNDQGVPQWVNFDEVQYLWSAWNTTDLDTYTEAGTWLCVPTGSPAHSSWPPDATNRMILEVFRTQVLAGGTASFLSIQRLTHINGGSTSPPSPFFWQRAQINTMSATIWSPWVRVGVPSGGTSGQLLSKASNAAGETAWVNAPPAIPTGQQFGQVLGVPAMTLTPAWVSSPLVLTPGGSNSTFTPSDTRADLNTYITSGIYTIIINAAPPASWPAAAGTALRSVMLETFPNTNVTSYRVLQRLTTLDGTERVFIRTGNATGTSWIAWRQVGGVNLADRIIATGIAWATQFPANTSDTGPWPNWGGPGLTPSGTLTLNNASNILSANPNPSGLFSLSAAGDRVVLPGRGAFLATIWIPDITGAGGHQGFPNPPMLQARVEFGYGAEGNWAGAHQTILSPFFPIPGGNTANTTLHWTCFIRTHPPGTGVGNGWLRPSWRAIGNTASPNAFTAVNWLRDVFTVQQLTVVS